MASRSSEIRRSDPLSQNEGLEIDSQTSNPTMEKPTYKKSK